MLLVAFRLFALSEELDVVDVCDVFESCLDKATRFIIGSIQYSGVPKSFYAIRLDSESLTVWRIATL